MSRFGDGRNRRAGARWALIIGRPDLRVALQGAVERQVQKIVNGLDSRVQARGSDSQPTRESADGQGGDAALVQKGDCVPGHLTASECADTAYRFGVSPVTHPPKVRFQRSLLG